MDAESNRLELRGKLQGFVDSSLAYQQTLHNLLQTVERQADLNEEKEKQLRTAISLSEDDRSGGLPVSKALYRTPYFQTADRTPVPTYHAEVEVAVFLNSEEPTTSRTYWSSKAEAALVNAVHAKKKDIITRDLNYERKKAERGSAVLQKELDHLPPSLPANDVAGWEHRCRLQNEIVTNNSRIAEIEVTLARLPTLPLSAEQFQKVEIPPHDWYYISTGTPQLQKHSPDACQLKYQFELDPSIKVGPWKSEERTTLRQLVERYGSRNWDAVAFDLNGRTAFDCCREYQRLQQEQRNSERAGLIRYGAEDIIMLIHTYVVAGGNWSLVGRMLPHRKMADIKRYWSRHLNPEVSRSSWSKKDGDKIKKFANDYRPDQGLEKLYAKFPDRLSWTVKKYFLDIYTIGEGNRWEEKDPERLFPTGQGYEKQAIIVKKLYEHILETVTKPLRENSSQTLAGVLKSEKVVGPVRNFMTDLQLYPEISNTAESYDAVVQTLSPADHKLIELFGAPMLDAVTRKGRKKHVNCFGDIPVRLQPKTSAERVEIVSAGFMAEHEDNRSTPAVCLPPSLPILNGLLKLKQLCLHAPLPTQEVLSLCDPYDLRAMERRAVSVFVTSEIALINSLDNAGQLQNHDEVDSPVMAHATDLTEGPHNGMSLDITVEPEKEVEVTPFFDTSMPQKPAKEQRRRPGRKVNTKKTLLKKIKWMAQNENQKKIERDANKVIIAEKVAAGEKKPRKKRLAAALAVPNSEKRRSSRLKPTNEPDDSSSTVFLAEPNDDDDDEDYDEDDDTASSQPSTSHQQNSPLDFDMSVLHLIPTYYSFDPLNAAQNGSLSDENT